VCRASLTVVGPGESSASPVVSYGASHALRVSRVPNDADGDKRRGIDAGKRDEAEERDGWGDKCRDITKGNTFALLLLRTNN